MITGTFSTTETSKKYPDKTTGDLIEWVRDVPLESDAWENIPRILLAYEKRKTLKQRVLAVFGVYSDLLRKGKK